MGHLQMITKWLGEAAQLPFVMILANARDGIGSLSDQSECLADATCPSFVSYSGTRLTSSLMLASASPPSPKSNGQDDTFLSRLAMVDACTSMGFNLASSAKRKRVTSSKMASSRLRRRRPAFIDGIFVVGKGGHRHFRHHYRTKRGS